MIVFAAAAALATDLDASGSVAANLHFGLQCGGRPADCPWLDFQDLVVGRGLLKGDLHPDVSVRGEVALRLHAAHGVDEVGDAASGSAVQPFSLDVPEAWVEVREVVVPALALRLGQQRLAWGVADGVNPVDVVNPYDLADPTRFDRRLGIPAATARLSHRGAALELVYVPLFRPARMPSELDLLEDADELFDFSDVGAGDADIGELETRTTVPDGRVGFSAGAARASLVTPAADLALVGYYGRDSLPQVGGEARLIGIATASGRVDVGIPVVYPRMGLVGLEVRAPLFLEIAGWIEAAAVFPERLEVTASRAQLEDLVQLGVIDEIPDPLPVTVIQDGVPYPRWVAGLERFFGPVVVNAQWVHGLPTERTGAEVGDYGALGLRITASETVRVDVRAVSDGRGYLVGATVAALHRDTATLTLGATWVDGPDGSALGRLRGMSNASAGLEVAF